MLVFGYINCFSTNETGLFSDVGLQRCDEAVVLEVSTFYCAQFAWKKDLSYLQGIVFVLIIQHGVATSYKPAVTVMVVQSA